MHFLSIITINYNNAEALKKTIDSVRVQKFTDYEHIIVDGGSTDGSVDVICESLKDEKYAEHVSWWCSEKDEGIWNAMNKGVSHAQGNYCLLLNSGDWLCNEKCLSVAYENSKTGEDIIYFDIFMVTSKKIFRITYPEKIHSYFFLQRNTLSHQNTLIKTSLQKKIPYTNNYRYAGDIEFFATAFLKQDCSSKHVNKVLAYYDAEYGISSIPETAKERAEEWKRLHVQFYPNQRIREDLSELIRYTTRYQRILEYLYSIIRKIVFLLRGGK